MLTVDFIDIDFFQQCVSILGKHDYGPHGRISFCEKKDQPRDETQAKGGVTYPWGIFKGVFDFKDIEHVAYVDNAIIVKLKDGENNYLLIKNVPYEKFVKIRPSFQAWGIEVRN